MRRCSAGWLLLLVSCAIPLEKPSASVLDGGVRPTADGCLLFRNSPNIALLQGARGSVVLPGGSTLWSFSGATTADGGSISNGPGIAVSGDDPATCFSSTTAGTTPLFTPSPLNAEFLLAPLDLIRIDDAIWSYYQAFQLDSSQPFGVRSVGFGVARRNDQTGQFEPTTQLLWAGDGPSYGTSALVLDGDIYAYGSKDSDSYVAKVPVASIDDPDAYIYAIGSNRFSSDRDFARPIVNGTGGINVRSHLSGRLLATYVPPIGGTLMVRSLLGPTGPFSKEYPLADCSLGDGDFCVGGVRHPELETDMTQIAVSYVAANFNGTSPGDRYWPRLAFLPLPSELP